jgi:hypothetical protein
MLDAREGRCGQKLSTRCNLRHWSADRAGAKPPAHAAIFKMERADGLPILVFGVCVAEWWRDRTSGRLTYVSAPTRRLVLTGRTRELVSEMAAAAWQLLDNGVGQIEQLERELVDLEVSVIDETQRDAVGVSGHTAMRRSVGGSLSKTKKEGAALLGWGRAAPSGAETERMRGTRTARTV